MTNACTVRPNMVTLATGEQVSSSSPAWLAECEARAVLAMPMPAREAFLADVERKRGAPAAGALKHRCFALEPHYVLSLPNRAQRNAYVEQVERRFGHNPAEALRLKVRELHANRVAERDAQAA